MIMIKLVKLTLLLGTVRVHQSRMVVFVWRILEMWSQATPIFDITVNLLKSRWYTVILQKLHSSKQNGGLCLWHTRDVKSGYAYIWYHGKFIKITLIHRDFAEATLLCSFWDQFKYNIIWKLWIVMVLPQIT
jgi:hypothetical protein